MPDSFEHDTDPLIEQVLRLGNLRKEVMDRIEGPLIEGGTGQFPMEQQEAFWKQVLAFEDAEESTFEERLKAEANFVTPDPDSLETYAEVSEALWNLIHALASIRVFLDCTDHLDDRDLYRLLVFGALPDASTVPPTGTEWNTRILAYEYGAPGDPDGTLTYLRYYADDETREEWDAGEIPSKGELPHDRDRLLPNPENLG